MKSRFLYLLLLLTLALCKISTAQVPGFEWAKNIGGTAILNGSSAATDASGNVYTTGNFAGTADFNPGTGIFELTSNDYDGFVSKVDANGNFVWAIQFGGGLYDAGTSITIDAAGNVVVAGYFAETVNFDPGVSDFELTAFGGWDGVILKLTSTGNFVFAKQLGGVDDDYITGIQTDASNNIYSTGSFNGVADFDPDDVAVFELTSNGGTDVFVTKLNVNGNFEWAVPFGRSEGDVGVSVAIDPFGNIYLTGQYEDIDTSGDYSIFIIKLDTDGNQVWNWELLDSTTGIATGYNTVNSIITDAAGDVFFSGTFNGTVDFDPLGAGFDLTGPDSYIGKLNSLGVLVWAKKLGLSGVNSDATSMTLDINGNIFLTGYYYEKVDIDPGADIANIYTSHSDDSGMFVLKLDNNGNYVWAQGFSKPEGAESGTFITTDNTGNIYVVGDFSGTTVFATGVCASAALTDLSGDGSSFLLKLNHTSVPATCFGVIEQPVSTDVCEGNDITIISMAAGAPRITYQWQRFNGTTFVDISDQEYDGDGTDGYEGTNSPFLTLQFNDGSGTEQFRCEVSGESVSDVYSDVATLTLQGSNDIPYVVANSGCGPGQYLITASGASDGEYRWYQAGGLIDGEVNSTYTTPFISSPTEFSVTKGTGSCQSAEVKVVVKTDACAPVPGLVWVAQPQITTGNVNVKKLAIDAAGTVYAVGTFRGTVDFDTGAGDAILTSVSPTVEENFLLKLTEDRNVVWVKSLNSINTNIQISLDGSGSIYLSGSFSGTVDFNPGTADFSMTATGTRDMFITKLDTDGNFIWAKRMGGTGSAIINSRSVASDANGVYATGSFTRTIDFDPNASVLNLTASTTFTDIFICKLDASGNLAAGAGWAFKLGTNAATDAGVAIKVDAAGNVYSTGTFFGTVDFDPAGTTFSLTGGGATDLYIHKLNNAGVFQWARNIGGAGVELPYALALDASGNPHLTGTFGTIITNQTVDFDPGTGTHNLVSTQGIIFILKLTSAGGFTWAKNFGGTFAAEPNDITVDAAGNVLTIGDAEGISGYNPDYDPGTGIYLLKSNVNRDIFVSQLDANGNFSWAFNMASTGLSYYNNDGLSIVTDPDGSIYTAGAFTHTSDLDPGHCTFPLFDEDGGTFIQKIKPGVAALCFNLQPITAAVCIETQVTFSVAATGTTNITYQWQKLNTGTSLFEDITDTGGYSGATSPDLHIDTNGNFGAGSYQCKVTGDNAPDKNSSIVTLTVNTPSSPPTVTGSTSCTVVPQTLTASGSTDGNYRWYEEATGGTAISSEVNSTYTTPSISTTTTYFVSIHNGTCESVRTPVVAEFSTTLGAPTTTGDSSCETAALTLSASGGSDGQYRWYSVATGGTPITGEVNSSYTTPILSTTTTYFVAINDGTCESTRTSVIATINTPPLSTTTGGSLCGAGTVVINASGGTNGQYRWYSVPTGGTAIAGEVNSSYTTPSISTTTTYFVAINNGTCESTRTPAIATINTPPAAPTTTGGSSCGATAVIVNASGATNGEYRWYDVATGGTAIAGAVNSSYTTPSISTTTTYYVSINNGICESTRTSVIAQIDTPPAAPTTTSGSSCGTSSVIVNASGATNGEYRWYNVASGGIAIAGEVNSSYTTPSISTTTTYYISINNGTCESTRTSVIAQIDTPPAAPTTTGASNCGTSTLTLNATGGINGEYRWYDVPSGGTAIAGELNSSYTTPSISTTTTYYVAINNGTCESLRSPSVATINAVPSKPLITSSGSTTLCTGQSVTLSAPVGFTYSWSTGATSQQIIVNTSGNFTVQITSAGCTSVASDPVTVSVSACNQPPVIATASLQTEVEGSVSLPITGLLSDPDNNLDLSTLRIVQSPSSGASATINSNNELILNYQGLSFAGIDELTIEVCDLDGECVQQKITIEVIGDIVAYNAISPNTDDKNPALILKYIEAIEETQKNKVSIYNRWGDVVWEGVNYNNTSVVFIGLNKNGNELPTGTYFYKIEFASGRKTDSGYLSLKR